MQPNTILKMIPIALVILLLLTGMQTYQLFSDLSDARVIPSVEQENMEIVNNGSKHPEYVIHTSGSLWALRYNIDVQLTKNEYKALVPGQPFTFYGGNMSKGLLLKQYFSKIGRNITFAALLFGLKIFIKKHE